MVLVNFVVLRRWKGPIFLFFCPIINSVYVYFTPLFNNFCPGGLTLKEKIMGMTVIDNDNKSILRNYITSTIKHIAFRSRNKIFSDAIAAIINIIKNFIKKRSLIQMEGCI